MKGSQKGLWMEPGPVRIGEVVQEVLMMHAVMLNDRGCNTLAALGFSDFHQLACPETFSSAMEALARACETGAVDSVEMPAVVFVISELMQRDVISPAVVTDWYNGLRKTLRSATGKRRWHNILYVFEQVGIKWELFE
jgi:hypothetical protein